MIRSKYITVICCIIMAAAVLFTGAAMFIPVRDVAQASEKEMPEYAKKLFDTSYVHTIDISISEKDWENMLKDAVSEEYKSCDVTIDGTKVKNVAIRPKGNTSLTNVQSLDSDRYSFKIDFGKYSDGGNYLGLDKLCLNNIIQDNTYMKDYFSYRMINEAGGLAPLCSYIYVTVNGKEHGLYLAVEGIEKAFAERNFGSDYGFIYKPESMAMGKDKGKAPSPPDDFENMNKDGNQPFPEGGDDNKREDGKDGGISDKPSGDINQPRDDGETDKNRLGEDMQQGDDKGMPGPGGMKNSAVSLQYIDDDIDSYSDIFDYSVFDADKSDKKRLIQSIKQLNEGENLSEVTDVDEVLKYFVGHNFTVNFDSYTGNMMHNYYLHEKDGQMSMIAWDYNLAFGGFSQGGMGGKNPMDMDKNGEDMPDAENGSQSDNENRERRGPENMGMTAEEAVNYPIDTPTSGTTLEERPMIGKLLECEEYMDLYHKYMDEFISEYIESGKFEKEYNTVYNMIYKYVAKDPTKFCTLEEFVKGADTLKNFCLLRCQSVRGQLNGEIPSTSDGQENDSSSLVDASGITISDMGSMDSGREEKFDKKSPDEGFNKDMKAPPGGMGENKSDGKGILILIISIVVLSAALAAVKLYRRK